MKRVFFWAFFILLWMAGLPAGAAAAGEGLTLRAIERWRNTPNPTAPAFQLLMVLVVVLDHTVRGISYHRMNGVCRQLGQPLDGVTQDIGCLVGKVRARLCADLPNLCPLLYLMLDKRIAPTWSALTAFAPRPGGQLLIQLRHVSPQPVFVCQRPRRRID